VRGEFVDLDLAKLADVANALALEGAEVGGDARVFEVDNTSEGFVKKTADGLDGEVSSLGGESVNHGLEAKIDLSSADDLSDILDKSVSLPPLTVVERTTHTRIIRLQESNLDSLLLKVSLRLS